MEARIDWNGIQNVQFVHNLVNTILATHVHVRYKPSPVRLPVCPLSSVTLVRPTEVVEIFGNISTAFGTLALTSTENFAEIVPGEPLRRGS